MPSQVAKLFGLSKDEVLSWIDQGELLAVTLPTGKKRIIGPVLAAFAKRLGMQVYASHADMLEPQVRVETSPQRNRAPERRTLDLS